MGKLAKNENWCNFWLEGPIDLRPTCLNCILQDHFRDTPLDHISRAQICTQICIFGIFGHIWHIWVHIWACAIWSSGVSLKRSCKMQFRRVGLRSIGPSSQKFWTNVWTKGSPPSPNLQFFWTLFKKPLTPPLVLNIMLQIFWRIF